VIVFGLLTGLWPVINAAAGEMTPVGLDGGKLFAAFDKKAKADRNISGATCFADRNCILVADEMVAVQRVKLDIDGQANSFTVGPHFGALFHRYCKNVGRKKGCDEVDLEAIARHQNDVLITGSMGNASKSGKKAKKRWFLARFSVDEDGDPDLTSLQVQSRRKILKHLFSQHGELGRFVEKPLQCGGLNIEGLASIGDQIFFGLRSPGNRQSGQAILVQSPVSILAVEDKSDVEATTVHTLRFVDESGQPLQNIGIRALEELDGKILIATGVSGVAAPRSFEHLQDITRKCADILAKDGRLNVADKPPMQPRIWVWDPATGGEPIEIARLGGEYVDEKLEGIAVLERSSGSSIDLLLTIDGPKDVEPLAVLRGVRLPE
jgi:hypothetical protein